MALKLFDAWRVSAILIAYLGDQEINLYQRSTTRQRCRACVPAWAPLWAHSGHLQTSSRCIRSTATHGNGE